MKNSFKAETAFPHLRRIIPFRKKGFSSPFPERCHYSFWQSLRIASKQCRDRRQLW